MLTGQLHKTLLIIKRSIKKRSQWLGFCDGWEYHTDQSMRCSDALVDANEKGARISNSVPKIWVVHVISG